MVTLFQLNRKGISRHDGPGSPHFFEFESPHNPERGESGHFSIPTSAKMSTFGEYFRVTT
jgi:hypothetical protein